MFKVYIEKREYNSETDCEWVSDFVSVDAIKPDKISEEEWDIIESIVLELAKGNKSIVKDIKGKIEGGVPFIKGVGEATRKRIVTRTPPYSGEDELRALCRALCDSGLKILIGIDDIAVTEPMVAFLSIIGTFFMDSNINIRLIATGLQSNIERFYQVPHLSFFARPKAFVVQNLNLHDVKRMYKTLIGIDDETAGRLSELSKGYAFGYQMLGDEFFGKKDGETLDDVLNSFDLRIAPTYDLLWETLTPAERGVVKEVAFSESGKREELAKKIKGFSQHRHNLIKKHIVNGNGLGELRIELPRFRDIVYQFLYISCSCIRNDWLVIVRKVWIN